MRTVKKKICFVDDEQDIVLLCKLLLEYEGYEVYAFTDPISALTNYKSSFYDLIILDITMPKMDGFELYKKIREIDKESKVCFLTASEMQYERFKKNGLEQLNKNNFLRKPIENDDLIIKVKQLIDI